LDRVALRDTGDQVGHQGAGQPVQRPVVPVVVRTVHHDGAIFVARHGDRLGDLQVQGALGPLHRDLLAVDGNLDPGWNQNRLLTNTRHVSVPSHHTYARTSPPTPCL